MKCPIVAPLEIKTIPCLNDNYAYLLIDNSKKEAIVVDPGEAFSINQFLQEKDINLKAIWNTHHHFDHTGGNVELCKNFSHVDVCASKLSRGKIPQQNVFLTENDVLEFCGTSFRIIDCPGHTLDGISFVSQKEIFTGDTLFSAGCGRIFEGTYSQMFSSIQKIVSLNDSIKIYYGHDYTEKNLNFAQSVEKNNQIIQQKLEGYRQGNIIFPPTTLQQEKMINPFLRTESKDIRKILQLNLNATPLEVFITLRKRRDNF